MNQGIERKYKDKTRQKNSIPINIPIVVGHQNG
jgi:hypothetical protein